MTVLSINMAKQIQFVGKIFMRNFKPVLEVLDFCESKKVCPLSSGIDSNLHPKRHHADHLEHATAWISAGQGTTAITLTRVASGRRSTNHRRRQFWVGPCAYCLADNCHGCL